MNTCLVLVGPHGSGKSTLGREVAAKLGWRFDPEIGEALRLEALAADPGAHACRSQAAFDRLVITRELARDQERRGAGSRVIETWHPGNLAYAWNRSQAVADALRNEVVRSVARRRRAVVVQPLRIRRETLVQRLREPGPEGPAFVEWLWMVGEEARIVALSLGLTVLPPLETDRCSIGEAARAICEAMDGVSGRSTSCRAEDGECG